MSKEFYNKIKLIVLLKRKFCILRWSFWILIDPSKYSLMTLFKASSNLRYLNFICLRGEYHPPQLFPRLSLNSPPRLSKQSIRKYWETQLLFARCFLFQPSLFNNVLMNNPVSHVAWKYKINGSNMFLSVSDNDAMMTSNWFKHLNL